VLLSGLGKAWLEKNLVGSLDAVDVAEDVRHEGYILFVIIEGKESVKL